MKRNGGAQIMNDHRDRQWLKRAADGDQSAFRSLVETYKDPLYAFVLRMVRRPAIAEELVQETFVRAWRAAPRYRATGAVSTWLFCIAHRLAINEAAKVRHVTEISVETAHVKEPASRLPDAAKTLEQKRHLQAVETAIDTLPPRQRAAVILARIQGLTYRQVATIMNISEKAVDSLLHRAETTLRHHLRDIF